MPGRTVDGVTHDDAPADALGTGVLGGVGRRNAIDAVRLRIGMAISLGMLRPGERLPDQEEVARGLSVSPMTARRALMSLADDGVLVRRRGRSGGTFVADRPCAEALRRLVVPGAETVEVHGLIDRRLLMECSLAHFAALRATDGHLRHLEELTRRMAEAQSWSDYHQADDAFHRAVAEAAAVGSAAEEYLRVLEQLYGYFIPYPIDQLHLSNHDHIGLVRALAARDCRTAVDVTHQHVDRLHRTMFVGLLEARRPDDAAGPA